MPDDPNITQNQDSETNPIPTGPASFDPAQDLSESPMADAPIPSMNSESFDHTQDLRPAEALSEAPEASRDGFNGESNNSCYNVKI